VANTSGNEGGSAAHPFNTIQEGIDASASGDVVGVDAAPRADRFYRRTTTSAGRGSSYIVHRMIERPTVPRARAPVGRIALIVGAVVSTAAAFLFRFLSIDFVNDQFMHMAWAWHILQGELPIRDFVEPGFIGQSFASAVALRMSGHNLLGEGLLTTAFIAAGAGLTFVASAWMSRSIRIASMATLIAVLSMPRLYGYPKVFFYGLALVGAWRYAHRPGRRSLAALALITAVAFLFRHDHGVYIGLSYVALIAIRHFDEYRSLARAMARYSVATVALLAPFLAFVQTVEGLPRYVGGISPQIQNVSQFQVNWPPMMFDWSAPLLTITPAPELRVNVRWADEMADEAREALEHRYGLEKGEHVDGPTWSYVLARPDPARIGSLVNDPAVADTHGINRAARELDIQEPLYLQLQRWLPIFRTNLAPGILTRDNAVAWFYYVTLLIPIAGVALLVGLGWRRQIDRPEAAAAGAAVLLAIVVVQTLVRGSPDSRLPDVATPVSVLGAWIAAHCLGPAAPWSRPTRAVMSSVIWSVTLVTLWSVSANAHVLDNLDASRILAGPAAIVDRIGVVTSRLRERPIDSVAPGAPGLFGLARYVFECTAPTDRVLVPGFEPQVFFYSERGFAGGRSFLVAHWQDSEADQQRVIERLTRQRVPVVLGRDDAGFETRFPLVYEHLRRHYAKAPIHSPAMPGLWVMVDSRITPARTYEPLGLPCFR
jgi:hypothetical protein